MIPLLTLVLLLHLGSSSPPPRPPSHLYEYDYSDWYLLKLTPEEQVEVEEPTLLSSTLLTTLATKLAVPAHLFHVNSFTVDAERWITANLSVSWARAVGAPHLHLRLASLQLSSPRFLLPHPYTLALLLHARKQHVYVAAPINHSVAASSLGLLLSLILGGLGIFMLLLAAAFLLVLVLSSREGVEGEEVEEDEEDLVEEEVDGGRSGVAKLLDSLGRLVQRVAGAHERMILLK